MKINHWTEQKERASKKGIAFLIFVMNIAGPGFVKILVIPVALYYFLSSGPVRKASRDYLERLQQTQRAKNTRSALPKGCITWLQFRHVLSFCQSMVERVHSWNSLSATPECVTDAQELLDTVLNSGREGALIFVSHLGNFDLAIACTKTSSNKLFNIVMNTGHTCIYNHYREKMFDADKIRFIEPASITPMTMMKLVNRVSTGEIVIIAADRTVSADNKNDIFVNFLGGRAAFPPGPYILACLLGVPTYILFALKQQNGFRVHFEVFDKKIMLPRNERSLAIHSYAQRFASRLELQCIRYPLQWYNFYDFWEQSAETDSEQ